MQENNILKVSHLHWWIKWARTNRRLSVRIKVYGHRKVGRANRRLWDRKAKNPSLYRSYKSHLIHLLDFKQGLLWIKPDILQLITYFRRSVWESEEFRFLCLLKKIHRSQIWIAHQEPEVRVDYTLKDYWTILAPIHLLLNPWSRFIKISAQYQREKPPQNQNRNT